MRTAPPTSPSNIWPRRAIPGLDIVRPGDANETAVCWRTVLEGTDRPAGMILTRQNLPVLDRGPGGYAAADGAVRGGYVLAGADDTGIGQGWRDMVGDAGRIISLEHFGASADYQRLYQEFGITAEAVAQAARDSIHATSGPIRPGGDRQTASPTTGGTGDQPE